MNSIIFLSFIILLGGCQTPVSRDRACLSGRQVCFENQCVAVEVVRNQEDRARGLQFRDSLGEHKGMLFIFPESRKYGFWMKDTKIPLDIIWMDSVRQVVHIENNVPPCLKEPCPSYTPRTPARYVLEINAGHASRMGLQKGDWLEFHLPRIGN